MFVNRLTKVFQRDSAAENLTQNDNDSADAKTNTASASTTTRRDRTRSSAATEARTRTDSRMPSTSRSAPLRSAAPLHQIFSDDTTSSISGTKRGPSSDPILTLQTGREKAVGYERSEKKENRERKENREAKKERSPRDGNATTSDRQREKDTASHSRKDKSSARTTKPALHESSSYSMSSSSSSERSKGSKAPNPSPATSPTLSSTLSPTQSAALPFELDLTWQDEPTHLPARTILGYVEEGDKKKKTKEKGQKDQPAHESSSKPPSTRPPLSLFARLTGNKNDKNSSLLEPSTPHAKLSPIRPSRHEDNSQSRVDSRRDVRSSLSERDELSEDQSLSSKSTSSKKKVTGAIDVYRSGHKMREDNSSRGSEDTLSRSTGGNVNGAQQKAVHGLSEGATPMRTPTVAPVRFAPRGNRDWMAIDYALKTEQYKDTLDAISSGDTGQIVASIERLKKSIARSALEVASSSESAQKIYEENLLLQLPEILYTALFTLPASPVREFAEWMWNSSGIPMWKLDRKTGERDETRRLMVRLWESEEAAKMNILVEFCWRVGGEEMYHALNGALDGVAENLGLSQRDPPQPDELMQSQDLSRKWTMYRQLMHSWATVPPSVIQACTTHGDRGITVGAAKIARYSARHPSFLEESGLIHDYIKLACQHDSAITVGNLLLGKFIKISNKHKPKDSADFSKKNWKQLEHSDQAVKPATREDVLEGTRFLCAHIQKTAESFGAKRILEYLEHWPEMVDYQLMPTEGITRSKLLQVSIVLQKDRRSLARENLHLMGGEVWSKDISLPTNFPPLPMPSI